MTAIQTPPQTVSRPGAILVAMACSCCLAAAGAQGQIELRDVTRATGITFRHTDGGSGKRYLVEQVSAGLALFDYDGDGDVDVYFLNGAPLPGARAALPPKNALWRNDGNWRFTDVTDKAGVGDTGFSLGVAAGDYDNDGDPDLYVNNYGPNVLYRNNGNGTFTDVTRRAGVGNGHRVGAGVNFLDADRDGDLDLFVSNYVKFSVKAHDACTADRFPNYTGPVDYPPDADTLYRNNGDGTFTDVGRQSGLAAHPGPGMGTVCVDYDGDGDTDVFVANDVAANFLFRNDGDLDVVVLNSRREPTVLKNDTNNGNHWIEVALRGTKTNRDGVGARVTVVAGNLTQIDEVHSGRGYQSHYGTRLHFGLGKHERIDRIEVRWIGGGTDVVKNPAVNRVLAITEGTSTGARN